MSDNYLRLIPSDTTYVPSLAIGQQARELLALFTINADEVAASEYDEVQFVDAGSNWEGVFCPACGAPIENEIWRTLVDQAFMTQFANLIVIMPCCGITVSLNDLHYEWPAGFARFVLQARNPGGDVSLEQIQRLEALLGCRLRKIWAHY